MPRVAEHVLRTLKMGESLKQQLLIFLSVCSAAGEEGSGY